MLRYAMLSDDSCHLYTFQYSRQHKHQTFSDILCQISGWHIRPNYYCSRDCWLLSWIKTSLMQLILQHVWC